MNSKQIIVLVGSVLVCGALLWTSSQPVPPQPGPGPTPGPVVDGIAKVAAGDGATFLNALGENCGAAARKIKDGELKTSDQVHAWLKQANESARAAAFKPWHREIQSAIDAKDIDKLADLLEASATGFPSAIKGK